MFRLNEACLDKLCNIAAGVGVLAAGLATGGGALLFGAAAAQMAFGAGGFLAAVRSDGKRSAEGELAKVRAQIERDFARWIDAEFDRDRDLAEHQLNDAIAAFDAVLPQIVPAPKEIVDARLDATRLGEILLAKAAAFDPRFRDGAPDANPLAPRVLRAVITGVWELWRVDPTVYDRLRSHVDQAILQGIDRIEGRLDTHTETLHRHTEMLQSILDSVSREKGVPAQPLQAILAKLGEQHVPIEEIPARLAAKADELVALREQWTRLSNRDPEVADVRREALALLDAGDLDAARERLAEARARIRAAREQRADEEAALLADEAHIDRLQLRYREAAENYAEAARLVAFDPERAFAFKLDQGNALISLGEEFGDNRALSEAIDLWHGVLATLSREAWPAQWAAAQGSLGIALLRLGEREGSSERLEEAVEAFRAALKEHTRERVPLDWAMTQNNLGSALLELGQREGSSERLAQAVEAFRAALQVFDAGDAQRYAEIARANLARALARLAALKGEGA